MLVFDLDGTLFDTRRMVCHALRKWLPDLLPADVTKHEDHIDYLISSLPAAQQAEAKHFYYQHYRTPEADVHAGIYEPVEHMLLSWRPLPLVAATGRVESQRIQTRELLAFWYPNLHVPLFMRNEGETSPTAKCRALHAMWDAGYTVDKFLDNEPEVLAAVDALPRGKEVDLVLIDSVRSSSLDWLPERAERLTVHG
jgi:hypothetical protein